MSKEIIISANKIVKKFGSLAAVDNVSMDVYSGEIYGVAGLNGAGKSTLLAILAGVMRPDGGTVLYAGAGNAGMAEDARTEAAQANVGAGNAGMAEGARTEAAQANANMANALEASAKNIRIGYVPQDIALFPDLSVYDNLKFWALAGSNIKPPRRRRPARTIKERIISVSETAGLSDRLRQYVRDLSGGMKQRVNIAAALVAEPDALIMDEPTAGLDVKNRRDILNFINSLAKNSRDGLAVVCTSHQSGELEMISDRLLLLDRGKTVYDGPPVNVFTGAYSSYANIDDILYSLGGGNA